MKFNNEIQKNLSKLTKTEVTYDAFMKAMMKAAEVTIPGEGRINKDWFQTSKDELLKAIGQRKYWFKVCVKKRQVQERNSKKLEGNSKTK
eukprot:scaffold293198_cov40-Attheya_sp.AAC.1